MKPISLKRGFLAGVAVAGLMAAGAAHAQTASPAEATTAVDDIVVTAQLRAQDPIEVPFALTAYSGAFLESLGVQEFDQLSGFVPGFLVQNQSPNNPGFVMRGITSDSGAATAEPRVSVYQDGVSISKSRGSYVELFDMERIEVAKGPQSTLYGRGALIGAVNLVQNRARLGRFDAAARIEAGDMDYRSVEGFVNAPLGETGALRLATRMKTRDGTVENLLGGENYNSIETKAVRLSGAWAPTEDLSFDLIANYQVDDASATSFKSIAYHPADPKTGAVLGGRDPWEGAALTPGADFDGGVGLGLDREVWGVTGLAKWRLSPSLTLNSTTAYRTFDSTEVFDPDGLSLPLLTAAEHAHGKQWSQELRAAGNLFTGFDYVVGAYYFHSKYDLTQWTRFFGFDPSIPPTEFDRNPQTNVGKTTSYAFFGDFNWAFADKWRLSFGGRWSHDNKKLTNSFAQTGLIGSGDANFTKFTPKVGIDYRPNNDVMLYSSWSRGYRSGGFSPRAATALTASTPFQPETVDAYEIGAKLAAFNRKLEVNLAGYISDYKDMQQNLTVPGGPLGNQTITGNVPGGAMIKGIEMDATVRITPQLTITASTAYMKSHFRNFVTNGAFGTQIVPFDYSANRLIYAPKFTSSLNADYTVPTSFGKVVATAGWRHISPYDEQISQASLTPVTDASGTVTGVIVGGNDPRVRTTTQDLVDASLTVNFDIGDKEAYVRLFGRNLLNEKTTTHAFTVAGLFSFGMALEPRTYGATVGVKF
ncbi:MAG TPA: TonB-dependent receptor [Brevundimonas sp.]|nr:TonB-dependent receptor [Brevundimonas sp.]